MGQNNDFDQFVDFIAHFSYELTSGASPEFALVRTADYFGDQTPDSIRRAIRGILEGTKSFRKAWGDLGSMYSYTKYSRLVELLGRFLEKGSKVGGERMLQVIKEVRKNNAMTKARKSLISSQKVKVLALALVSSIVLGMITALAPMLSLAFIAGGFNYPDSGIQTPFSFSVLTALLLTVIVTGYRLNQTVEGSMRTVFLYVMAFGCTYILTSQLLFAFI